MYVIVMDRTHVGNISTAIRGKGATMKCTVYYVTCSCKGTAGKYLLNYNANEIRIQASCADFLVELPCFPEKGITVSFM